MITFMDLQVNTLPVLSNPWYIWKFLGPILYPLPQQHITLSPHFSAIFLLPVDCF